MTHIRRYQLWGVGIIFLFIFTLLSHTGALSRSMPDESLGYRLKTFGYTDEEIKDILSKKRSRWRIDLELKLKMLGYSAIEAARLANGMENKPGPSRRVEKEEIPYFHHIQKAAEHTGVDPHLVSAIIKAESGFNPNAVSASGAVGLMQLMPETALKMGVRDIFDPHENIWGGTRYLSYCIEKFGDIELALAAYNAGPGLVAKLNQVPDIDATRAYIRRVMNYRSKFGTSKNGTVEKTRIRHSSIHITPLITIEQDMANGSLMEIVENAGTAVG